MIAFDHLKTGLIQYLDGYFTSTQALAWSVCPLKATIYLQELGNSTVGITKVN